MSALKFLAFKVVRVTTSACPVSHEILTKTYLNFARIMSNNISGQPERGSHFENS